MAFALKANTCPNFLNNLKGINLGIVRRSLGEGGLNAVQKSW